ncbi:hypothetical protein JQN72_03360 [Phycicoccus sp. CSK15P-2]|uniref:hypothetical protein n=1 Tax=Phycicoccus sp. CSK15P-2 TaxID=2807627 RepID=UPI00195291BD|nr:hypothetical protein [Phycicoccus sp. CSK15P-2]MBM6403284.1 hypothetical protein [Phycicoccus sp. CSK15P-2]
MKAPTAATGPPPAATTMSTAAAELLKVRTLRSTWWFCGGSAALLVLVALLETDDGDPGTVQSVVVVTGGVLYFVQYVLAAFAMLMMTAEFASRSITVSVVCTPVRSRVVVAKALVAAGTVSGLGLAVVTVAVLVAAARFGELGDLGVSQLRDVAALAAYLGAVAVVASGIGGVLRRTAGGMAVLVLLLLVVPELLQLGAERLTGSALGEVLAAVGDHTPAPAGYRFLAGEWADGLVLVGWAAAAVVASIVVLGRRDV